MNNREFDKIIKAGLSGSAGKVQPNWKRMESMVREWELNEGLLDDAGFDQLIAEKLATTQVGYDEQSWSRLEDKIKQRQSIGKKIIYYQLSGAAVILLFLMLLFQLVPGQQRSLDSNVVMQSTQQKPANPQILQDKTILLDKSEKENSASTQATTDFPTELSYSETNTGTGNEMASNPAIPSIHPIRMVGNNAIKSAESGRFIQIEFSISTQVDYSMNTGVDHVIGKGRKHETTGPFNQLTHPVRTIPAHLLLVKTADPGIREDMAMELTPVISEINPLSQVKHWTLGVIARPILSLVRSPFDEIMQEPGYERNAFNWGTGLVAGYDFGNTSLRTGISYSRLDYSPREVTEYIPEEESHIHLDKIGLDFLAIPLHVQYDIIEGKDLKFYGLSGFSFRMVLGTKYNFEVEQNGLAYLINDLKMNTAYQQTLLSQKDFEPGIMGGGKLGKAIFASVDLGFGIEYELNDSWSLFFEPQYAHDLSKQGFGPNGDKIHSLSFQAGVKGIIN